MEDSDLEFENDDSDDVDQIVEEESSDETIEDDLSKTGDEEENISKAIKEKPQENTLKSLQLNISNAEELREKKIDSKKQEDKSVQSKDSRKKANFGKDLSDDEDSLFLDEDFNTENNLGKIRKGKELESGKIHKKRKLSNISVKLKQYKIDKLLANF